MHPCRSPSFVTSMRRAPGRDTADLAGQGDTAHFCHRNMVMVRSYDKKAIALQRTGKLGTFLPPGAEAVGIGVGLAMQPEDVYVPYRGHAHPLLRGRAHGAEPPAVLGRG